MTNIYEDTSRQLEPLWTVNQTAKYFGLNIMTIYQWISKGKIKRVKIGNCVRIPRSEIERMACVSQKKIIDRSLKQEIHPV